MRAFVKLNLSGTVLQKNCTNIMAEMSVVVVLVVGLRKPDSKTNWPPGKANLVVFLLILHFESNCYMFMCAYLL